MSTSKRFLALLTLAAMTACGGGTSLPNSLSAPRVARRPRQAAGSDSFEHRRRRRQFDGGVSIQRIPRRNRRYGEDQLHQVRVPQGQENGFWADLWEEASGLSLDDAIDKVYDPTTSPLPLIKGPGLNNQIISVQSLRTHPRTEVRQYLHRQRRLQ